MANAGSGNLEEDVRTSQSPAPETDRPFSPEASDLQGHHRTGADGVEVIRQPVIHTVPFDDAVAATAGSTPPWPDAAHSFTEHLCRTCHRSWRADVKLGTLNGRCRGLAGYRCCGDPRTRDKPVWVKGSGAVVLLATPKNERRSFLVVQQETRWG